jgi:hypothetical protein
MEAESVELSAEDLAFIASVEEQTTPKSEKEKDLAAKAEPKDKITHKDVLVARGVIAKEEVEIDEASHQSAVTMKHVKDATPGEQKAAKNIKPGIAGYRDRIAMLKSAQARGGLKEEQGEEKAEKKSNNPFDWKNYKSAIKTKPGELTGHESKKISTGTVFTKKEVKEAASAEQRDTPGQEHICAVHVKHAKLGEGKTLHSQHAEPAEDGSIAWYDVMFAEGIVRVDTVDLEITLSESHMNHKKKA